MPGFELIDKLEAKAIQNLFKDGGVLLAHGLESIRKNFHVREFEKNCEKYFSSKYCLAVSSGTAAIKIGLLALGVKRGDEVITQSFNFIATIEAILDIGAIPVIANINKSLNIDEEEIEKLITKRTKVILPVHMLGVSVNMNKVKKIAKKYNLKILEDNCEAVGGRYKNKYLGTIGDVGVFSFDYGKMITTGEGGMVLTNSKKIDKFCREYHDHGHQNNPNFPRGKDTKKIYGFNYRMTEIQGVLGKIQLKKLKFMIKQNEARYSILDKYISKIFEVRLIPPQSNGSYDAYIFFVDNSKIRKKILKYLSDIKLGTKNLPDAMEWHCSFFWEHALDKKNIQRSKKTKNLLTTAIAIPILLKRSKNTYKKIGSYISSL